MNPRHTFNQSIEPVYGKEETKALFFYTVEAITGKDMAEILASDNYGLHPDQLSRFDDITRQLSKHVPIQHIFGMAEFRGLTFKVNKNVLIPRPETSELVDLVLSKCQKSKSNNILDIGTGSGCIAISIAKETKENNITACDISPAALKVAKRNAESNGVDINFCIANALNLSGTPLNEHRFDIIISNPPYIRKTERATMTKSVTDFEPGIALFVPDEDPLKFYRSISEFARNHLTTDGSLLFEINEKLSEETAELVENFGFTDVNIIDDCYGKQRFVTAHK